ncbi:MAG TPA: hypothetical protein VHP30_15645 [Ignavibacteriales bacterium]|nr:hypothetical protein [Ignavibacteriales bacterium]
MKFFDYIYYRGYLANWKGLGTDESSGAFNVGSLLGANITSVVMFILTYFIDSLSAVALIFLMVPGFFIGDRIAYYMYSYKERYRKVISDCSGKKFPKSYKYGMWAYSALSFTLLLGMIIFKLAYDDARIDKDPVYAKGVITNFSRYRVEHTFFTFTYSVNGERYTREEKYQEGKNRDLHIGDTCRIVYSRAHPGISKAMKINDKVLIVNDVSY